MQQLQRHLVVSGGGSGALGAGSDLVRGVNEVDKVAQAVAAPLRISVLEGDDTPDPYGVDSRIYEGPGVAGGDADDSSSSVGGGLDSPKE